MSFDSNAIQLGGLDMTVNPVFGTGDLGFNIDLGSGSAAPPLDLQEKRVTPTRETQIVQADPPYGGLSKVVVDEIPPQYGLVSYNGFTLKIE